MNLMRLIYIHDLLFHFFFLLQPIESLEVFNLCPTLKFGLSWTDDSEGLKPSIISPSEFIANNQYANRINFSGKKHACFKYWGECLRKQHRLLLGSRLIRICQCFR